MSAARAVVQLVLSVSAILVISDVISDPLFRRCMHCTAAMEICDGGNMGHRYPHPRTHCIALYHITGKSESGRGWKRVREQERMNVGQLGCFELGSRAVVIMDSWGIPVEGMYGTYLIGTYYL